MFYNLNYSVATTKEINDGCANFLLPFDELNQFAGLPTLDPQLFASAKVGTQSLQHRKGKQKTRQSAMPPFLSLV